MFLIIAIFNGIYLLLFSYWMITFYMQLSSLVLSQKLCLQFLSFLLLYHHTSQMFIKKMNLNLNSSFPMIFSISDRLYFHCYLGIDSMLRCTSSVQHRSQNRFTTNLASIYESVLRQIIIGDRVKAQLLGDSAKLQEVFIVLLPRAFIC